MAVAAVSDCDSWDALAQGAAQTRTTALMDLPQLQGFERMHAQLTRLLAARIASILGPDQTPHAEMAFTDQTSYGEFIISQADGTRAFRLTPDGLDNDIPREGKMTLIWATSNTDEFETYHTRRGTAVIDMGTGEFESIEYPVMWPYHAISMSLAMIFLAAAFFCVVHKKRLKKRYLRYHHWLGTTGVAFATIGLIIGVYMVAQLESGHIRVAHSVIASIDLVLAFTALAMGIVFQRRRDMKRRIRKPHMYVGALAILMMAVTVIVGVMYVFPV